MDQNVSTKLITGKLVFYSAYLVDFPIDIVVRLSNKVWHFADLVFDLVSDHVGRHYCPNFVQMIGVSQRSISYVKDVVSSIFF